MPKKRSVLLILAVMTLILFCSGCAAENPAEPAKSQNQPVIQNENQENDAAQQGKNGVGTQSIELKVYFASHDAQKLVPVVYKTMVTSQPAKAAIELLLAGPKNNDTLAVLPAGVKLLGIQIKEHVAYVDFDEALLKKHSGGSTAELMSVAAIVDTLTEFPDIEKVQILIEGKKAGTLAGHLDISEPLSRSETVIKK